MVGTRLKDGDTDGIFVGDFEGDDEGIREGDTDGVFVGASVGLGPGAPGEDVGCPAGGAFGAG